MEGTERKVGTVRAVRKQQKQQKHKGGSDISPPPRSPAHKAYQLHHTFTPEGMEGTERMMWTVRAVGEQ